VGDRQEPLFGTDWFGEAVENGKSPALQLALLAFVKEGGKA